MLATHNSISSVPLAIKMRALGMTVSDRQYNKIPTFAVMMSMHHVISISAGLEA
jgi:hypothetical protein